MKTQTTPNISNLRFYAFASYTLQILGIFAGLTTLISYCISYNQRKKAGETLYYSHFDWQIKTFWLVICTNVFIFAGIIIFHLSNSLILDFINSLYGISLMLLGLLEMLVGALLILSSIICNYRIIKGFVLLCRKKPVKGIKCFPII